MDCRQAHRLPGLRALVHAVGGGRPCGTIGNMDAVAADRSPLIREFDGAALYGALDAKRQAEGLSWAGAAAAIWNMAPALNAARDARGLANHPISPSTLQNLGKRGF